MSSNLKHDIETLKNEASELIGKAGFAVRNSKGFPEVCSLIEHIIDAIEKLNGKVDALLEAEFERLE